MSIRNLLVVRRMVRLIRLWVKVSIIYILYVVIVDVDIGVGNVQIIFDGFNEYNFNIDVMGGSYEFMK